MKILLLNTHQSAGGAALAATRLSESLARQGHQVTLLTLHTAEPHPLVRRVGSPWRRWWNFLWERLVIFAALGGSRRRLFELNIANTGLDLREHPAFREADLVHLHWTCQGLLSIEGIGQLLATGKPLVWTLHDLWPLRAIDPYRDDYLNLLSWPEQGSIFETARGEIDLPIPRSRALQALTLWTWRRKRAAYARGRLHFVACSHYLARKARLSPLTQGQDLTTIANPIDAQRFAPRSRAEARKHLGLPAEDKRRLLLFAAFRLTNRNKGYDLLAQALHHCLEAQPHWRESTAVLVMGGEGEALRAELPLEVFDLGYVTDPDTAAWAYAAADVFVLPSRSENLPNTIMEAMACGRAVLSFGVGGVPEMIDHLQTGYVAQPLSAKDLAAGLHHLLDVADRDALGQAARAKVEAQYAEAEVTAAYERLYATALGQADTSATAAPSAPLPTATIPPT